MTTKRMQQASLLVIGLTLICIAVYQPRWFLRWLSKRTPDVLFYANVPARIVALTIDDGPHPVVTPAILAVLARYRIAATFFLIGERVRGNEAIVRQIVAAGHEIGNHLMTDAPSICLSAEQFEEQLLQTHRMLSQFAAVRWFRPGSGWYTRRLIQQLKQHGYTCVIGSVYPYDAHIPWVPFLVRWIELKIFPGAVIVLHDGTAERLKTVDVLHHVLPKLQVQGYQFVTLSALAQASGFAETELPPKHGLHVKAPGYRQSHSFRCSSPYT
ncbi:MAG TPA: polysaccharide deacetylase family protein [Herpetosiphonaceae bacterium]